MNTQEIKDKLLTFHKPDAWKQSMVYSVWEDGEITLEKGGELFGARNLHCIQPGLPERIPLDLFPKTPDDVNHARIYVDTKKEADLARAFIENTLGYKKVEKQITITEYVKVI